MSKARVMAVVWRHIYNFKHSMDRVFDMFYWPAMDLLLWGLTTMYIRQAGGFPDLMAIILTAMVFWQVVWRAQYEITTNLLEEMWAHNMVNLFSTPLKVREWIVGVLLLGSIKMVVTIGFAFSLVWLMYGVSMFRVGMMLIPFVALLLMSGWWIGFFVSGFIVRWGTRIQTLAWSGVYLLAPFSAIYYPVKQLPGWAQSISRVLPTSYVFEGMRSVLFTGFLDQAGLVKAFGLTMIYLVLAVSFFLMMFGFSRKNGLTSLE